MASINLQENANFTRLCRLLVDKGTEALRKTLDAIHPPANLPAVLNTNRKSLVNLRFKVINGHQWDLLFPPSGDPPDSKTFDITLLNVLLRNICGLPPPATGWDKMPPVADRSQEANITRIKLFRNQIYAHVSSTLVDDTTFENLWQEISQALVQLKTPQKEIDDLKTGSLSPDEEMCVQRLKEWFLREEDCKHMLVDVQQHLYKESDTIKTSMQYLTQTTEENRQGIRQLRQLRSMQSERARCDSEDGKVDEKLVNSMEVQLLQQLAKHNFKSKIENKIKSFHPGTRDWLLRKVENWFTTEDESRLLLITAGPGFGKSVFAAKVCQLFKENEKLAACHFCDFSDSNLKDPMMMLQSLASHMSENVSGFKEKLLDQLKRPHKVNNLKDAFQIYLQNPLDELEAEPSLILIDGLDEIAADDKSDMMKIVTDHFPGLPKCAKVLITSRQELSLQTLDHIQTIHIGAGNNENALDLLEYLKVSLPSLAARDAVNAATQTHQSCVSHFAVLPAIVKKCEGSFLYAFHVHHELCKRKNLDSLPFEEIMSFLPNGIGSVYYTYFHRFEKELDAIVNKKPYLYKLLEILVAANKSLPLKFIARALGLNLDCRETKRIINKLNEAVSCLLYVSNDEVRIFHKSVYDWVLGIGYDRHEYTVEKSDGVKRLWLLCEQIFREMKKSFRHNLRLNDLKLTNDMKYALEHGHKYLLACNVSDSLYWLVDMVIVYFQTAVHPKCIRHLDVVLEKVLRTDMAKNLKIRQRISWHLLEVCPREFFERRFPGPDPMEIFEEHFSYLETILDRSPEGLFTNDEKEIVKALTARVPRLISDRASTVVLPLVKPFKSAIVKVGVSLNRELIAVALEDGTVCVLRLPDLVEIWLTSTTYKNIPCCTFAPNGLIVLYGKLETALSITEKREISFFNGYEEEFNACAFSPNGNRLVTSNGSSTLKLWDVVRRCLLTVLCAQDCLLHFCDFSNNGLFVIAGQRSYKKHADCVWNAITLQRVDQRSVSVRKRKRRNAVLKSKRCERCFRPEHKEIIPRSTIMTIEYTSFTGIYRGVDCIFYFDENKSLRVIESTHFTTIKIWSIFRQYFTMKPYGMRISTIAAIEDNRWVFAQDEKLIAFDAVPPKED